MKNIKIEIKENYTPRNRLVELMYQNLKSGPHLISKKKDRQKNKIELKKSNFSD